MKKMDFKEWYESALKAFEMGEYAPFGSKEVDFDFTRKPETVTIFKPPCLGPSEAPRNPWHDIEQMFIEANQKIDRVIESHYIWGMLKIEAQAYSSMTDRYYHKIGNKVYHYPGTERLMNHRGIPVINSFPKIDPVKVKVDHHSMASFAHNVGFSAKDIINPDYVFTDPVWLIPESEISPKTHEEYIRWKRMKNWFNRPWKKKEPKQESAFLEAQKRFSEYWDKQKKKGE